MEHKSGQQIVNDSHSSLHNSLQLFSVHNSHFDTVLACGVTKQSSDCVAAMTVCWSEQSWAGLTGQGLCYLAPRAGQDRGCSGWRDLTNAAPGCGGQRGAGTHERPRRDTEALTHWHGNTGAATLSRQHGITRAVSWRHLERRCSINPMSGDAG